MRPKKLVLQAFGPYIRREEIDFERLKGNSIFLIHGPTGSGKSTILDAICYALYGDTSGADRSGEQLRSNWESNDLITEVDLSFAVGQKEYRVRRSPAQMVPKSRGEGFKSVGTTATLWIRDENSETTERVLVERKVKEVNSRIGAILGFKSDQFRQVIMLPQGKFREVLSADSRKREEILQLLFQTEYYYQIQQEFKERSRSLGQELKTLEERENVYLEQFGSDSVEELKERASLMNLELEKFTEGLQEKKKNEEEFSRKVGKAAAVEEKFKELLEAEKIHKNVLKRKGHIEIQEKKYSKAIDAEKLSPDYKRLSGYLEELEDIKIQLKNISDENLKCKKNIDETGKEIQKLAARENEKKELEKNIIELEGFSKKAEKIASAREDNVSARERFEQVRLKKEQINTQLETVENENAEFLDRKDKLHKSEIRLKKLQNDMKHVENIKKNLERIRNHKQNIADGKTELKKLSEEMEKLSKTIESRRIEVERLETQWKKGQAARLAMGLEDCKPCPVCGSLDHPHPTVSEVGIPVWDTIEANRQAVKKLEEDLNAYRSKFSGKETELKKDFEALAEVESETMAEAVTEDIEKKYNALKQEVQQLSRVVSGTEELERKIQNNKSTRAELILQKENQNLDFQKKYEESVKQGQLFQDLLAGIPEKYHEVDLKCELQKLAGKLEKMNQEYEECTRRYADLEKEKAGLDARIQQFEKERLDRESKLEGARESFASALTDKGFLSEEEFRTARLESKSMDILKNEIESYYQQKHSAVNRLERARKAVSQMERADLKALETRLGIIREELYKIIEEEKEKKSQIRQLENVLAKLKKVSEKRSKLDKKYSTFKHLSDLANGISHNKIAFQRYVLGALLDDVLIAASDRLIRMSNNRYRLHRIVTSSDSRKSAGLDLEIYDEYTGQSRPVSTLSGGEGFIASLSLALGLADVVQQYAGGIHMETIFIDEGFGSLDPESLDFAVNTLIDLNRSGRLVGVISHVPELRDRIDARLEVCPGSAGSRTKFHL